jgi:hypothetical protein
LINAIVSNGPVDDATVRQTCQLTSPRLVVTNEPTKPEGVPDDDGKRIAVTTGIAVSASIR